MKHDDPDYFDSEIFFLWWECQGRRHAFGQHDQSVNSEIFVRGGRFALTELYAAAP